MPDRQTISYTVTMIYFAHRGAHMQTVENTVSAFTLARQQGAVCYELDVHLLADGQLVVYHDYTLVSAEGESVALAKLSSADLKKYPLCGHIGTVAEQIPLLGDILLTVTDRLELLNIEIKNDGNRYPQIERVLLDFLKCYPALSSKILFSSFDFETLVRLRRLDKNARIGLLTRAFDVSQALAVSAESVHIGLSRATKEITDTCHAHGLKLYVYTVNDAQTVQQLSLWGVDGIFTDRIENFVAL